MLKKQTPLRLFALFIVGILTFSHFSAYATLKAYDVPKESTSKQEIIEFKALPEDILFQSVSFDTDLSLLQLPDSLQVSVKNIGDKEEKNTEFLTLSNIIWTSSPAYDAQTEGEYHFAPTLPTEYSITEDIVLPDICVTVEPNEPLEDTVLEEKKTIPDKSSSLSDEDLKNASETDSSFIIKQEEVSNDLSPSLEDDNTFSTDSKKEMALSSSTETGISYLDNNGTMQSAPSATLITDTTTTLTTGWYYTEGSLTLDTSLLISGDVHIILKDSSNLTITSNSSAGINVKEGNSLTIYGQSEENSAGHLEVNGAYNHAGIGSSIGENSGTITINGGNITAASGGYSAAIGSAIHSSYAGTITINGGVITASVPISMGEPAAIGGGGYSNAGLIKITGGTVIANGTHKGIGGGASTNAGSIEITGGYITANGIGCGIYEEYNPVSITGNAIVNTSAIYSETNYLGGLVIVRDTGTLYGNVTLEKDFSLTDSTLTIPSDKSLTIPSGITFTNNGQITNDGQIINNGTIVNNKSFTNNGSITNDGTITGTITGKTSRNSLARALITFDQNQSFQYTGQEIMPAISVTLETNELTKDTDYIISYSNHINAGTATVTVTGINNYIETVTTNFTINKSDFTGITFEDASFTYDGSPKSLAVTSSLPDGVRVSYSDNSFTDVGTYTVTATFSDGNPNFNQIPDMTASLTIKKADFTNITFEDASFTYDGSPKSLAISGSLPEGVIVSYSDNSFTDVGTYTVTATFSNDNPNFNQIPDMAASLTIKKADFTNITFEDASFTYDGSPKSLAISGSLPEGVIVSYSDNSFTNAGTYTVTATFSDGNPNFNQIPDMTASLTIKKADFNFTNITFEDASFSYDGSPKSLAISGSLPEGVIVSYSDNSLTDAGTYTITAHFQHENPNFNSIPDMTASLTIKKVTPTLVFFSNVDVTKEKIVLSASVSDLTNSIKPTGTVTFTDGIIVLAVCDLSNGTTVYEWAKPSSGQHVLSLSYSGDNNYNQTTLEINPYEVAESKPLTISTIPRGIHVLGIPYVDTTTVEELTSSDSTELTDNTTSNPATTPNNNETKSLSSKVDTISDSVVSDNQEDISDTTPVTNQTSDETTNNTPSDFTKEIPKEEASPANVPEALDNQSDNGSSSFQNLMNTVVFPASDVLIGLFLASEIKKSYLLYQQSKIRSFKKPVLLFLAFLFTLTAPLYIWNLF